MATYYFQYPSITVTSALPVGASTSALQTTGNTSLASIDTKTPTVGQKAMASSSPVVIASDQSAIPASQSGTWNITNVSGTVSLPTGAATETTLSGVSAKFGSLGQKTMTGSAPVVLASDQSAIPASQSGTWNITNVSGTVSLPTGAATETTLSGVNAKFGSLGQKAMTGSAPVVLASDQSAIPASQSGTWNITNVSGTVSLPTGAATSANQTSELTQLGATNETAPASDTATSGLNGRLQRVAQRITSLIAQIPAALGQTTMANSMSVAIASDQSAVSMKGATPTAKTVTQAAITVGTSAVRLTVAGTAPASTRVVLAATPDSASTAKFYIGSSSVTSSGATRGFQILAGQSFTSNFDAGDYYIISDTASQTVYVMEQA